MLKTILFQFSALKPTLKYPQLILDCPQKIKEHTISFQGYGVLLWFLLYHLKHIFLHFHLAVRNVPVVWHKSRKHPFAFHKIFLVEVDGTNCIRVHCIQKRRKISCFLKCSCHIHTSCIFLWLELLVFSILGVHMVRLFSCCLWLLHFRFPCHQSFFVSYTSLNIDLNYPFH